MRQVHSYNTCYIGKEGWGKCGLPAFWISLNHMTWEWTSWTPTARQESIEGQPPEERRSRCSSFSLAVSQQVPSDMLEVGMDQNLLFPIPYLDIFGGIRITIHLSACLVFTRVPEFWLIGFECETTLPWHPPLKEQELTKDLNIWNFLILRGGFTDHPSSRGFACADAVGKFCRQDDFNQNICRSSTSSWIPFSQNHCLAETKLLPSGNLT